MTELLVIAALIVIVCVTMYLIGKRNDQLNAMEKLEEAIRLKAKIDADIDSLSDADVIAELSKYKR